jgi:hypothetical protein
MSGSQQFRAGEFREVSPVFGLAYPFERLKFLVGYPEHYELLAFLGDGHGRTQATALLLPFGSRAKFEGCYHSVRRNVYLSQKIRSHFHLDCEHAADGVDQEIWSGLRISQLRMRMTAGQPGRGRAARLAEQPSRVAL